MKYTAILVCMVLTATVGVTMIRPQFWAEPVSGDFEIERLSVPDVTLIDQNNRKHAFPGPLTVDRVVVINFNYTTCESICPMGNDVMAQLDALVPTDTKLSLLSVTIDPSRDTPIHLRRAAEEFGASDRWHWLTGDVGEVRQLLAAFDADTYDIELHDPIFLVGDLKSGRYYRSLSMPTAEELAELVRRVEL